MESNRDENSRSIFTHLARRLIVFFWNVRTSKGQKKKRKKKKGKKSNQGKKKKKKKKKGKKSKQWKITEEARLVREFSESRRRIEMTHRFQALCNAFSNDKLTCHPRLTVQVKRPFDTSSVTFASPRSAY